MTVPTTSSPTGGPSTPASKGIAKPAMPPGMVMGPDGKPCKICTSFRNWKPGTNLNTEPDTAREKARVAGYPPRTNKQQGSNQSGTARTSMGAPVGLAMAGASTKVANDAYTNGQNDATGVVQTQERPSEPPADCPPDVEVLGRATWTFLHSAAAYYPEKPSPTQRANMLMLLRSLPIVYPCSWCADDFGKDIGQNPPDVSNREKLSLWLCQRHNEVNKKLGKATFDCTKVDERWKDGPPDGRCD